LAITNKTISYNEQRATTTTSTKEAEAVATKEDELLSSLVRQYNNITDSDIEKGLDKLFSLFTQAGQQQLKKIFPRTIMTRTTGGQVVVNSKEKMLQKFREANYIDLRVNAYPYVPVENALYIPNIIPIDIDINRALKTGEKLARQYLYKTLGNISYYSNNTSNPLVLWTGNGYHIYIALNLPCPLEQIEEYYHDIVATTKQSSPANGLVPVIDLQQNPSAISEEFLRYTKTKLTDGKADTKHNPSFKSSLLRVPNSINSKAKDKNNAQVKEIDNACSNATVTAATITTARDISLLLTGFRTHLISLKLQHEIKHDELIKSGKLKLHSNRSNNIHWIETLLQMQLTEHRKYVMSLILAPYFINIKHLSDADAFGKVKEWLSKCGKLKSLDPSYNFDYWIKQAINRCKSNKDLKPIRFENKLPESNPDLYKIIKSNMHRHNNFS
jgi:hypothetical protein